MVLTSRPAIRPGMEQTFDAIISATVRQAKDGQHLIWADCVAERIANATPLPIDRKALVEQLAAAAVHEGIPISFGGIERHECLC